MEKWLFFCAAMAGVRIYCMSVYGWILVYRIKGHTDQVIFTGSALESVLPLATDWLCCSATYFGVQTWNILLAHNKEFSFSNF